MSDDSQELGDEISTSTETSNDEMQPVDEIQQVDEVQPVDDIQPVDEIQQVDEVQSVDDIQPEEFDEWVVDIADRLDNLLSDPTKSLQASTDSNSEQKPSILSDILKPKIVHFGEYSSVETHNAWEFVAFMRDYFGLNVRSFLEDIQGRKDLVLSYYQTKEKHRCSKDFLEYLLINSCILVFAILSFQDRWNRRVDSTGTKEQTTDPRDQRYSGVFNKLNQHIMEDEIIFKCEMVSMDCQIPWFVVQAVYTKHSDLSKFVGTPIDELALSCFVDLYPRVHESKVNAGTLPPGGFKHLLHMFHWTRSPEGKFLVETRSLQPPMKMDLFYIPSATDLELSATVFIKHVSDSINVSYRDKRLSGVMQLSPWLIFDYSIKIYKGLLLFESVYGELCGFPITAYVACMVWLLQTDDDVRLLCTNGIVRSTRDDKNSVLRSVEELKKILSDDVPMSDDLYELSKKMTAHHERKSPRYYGEFISRYFANPWLTISVIVGIIYFFVNVIDAIYNTLSYYKISPTYNIYV
ncbi:uncharacterized protein LOC144544732 [Carex rostrata]